MLPTGGLYDFDDNADNTDDNFLTTIATCDVLCQILGDGLEFLCRPKLVLICIYCCF